MEATIGAVYMDGGFESAQRYVEEFILKDIEKKSPRQISLAHNASVGSHT